MIPVAKPTTDAPLAALFERYMIAPHLSAWQFIARVSLFSIPVLAASYLLSFYTGHGLPPSGYALLLGVALAGSFFSVGISSTEISLCAVTPIILAILYLDGAFWAVVADVASMVLQFLSMTLSFSSGRITQRLPWKAFKFGLRSNVVEQIVATGVPGILYQCAGMLHVFNQHSWMAAIALCAVSVVSFYINAFITTTVSSKLHKMRWDVIWYNNFKWNWPSALIFAPVGFIMGALSQESLAYGLAFVIVPFIAVHRGFANHEKRLEVYRLTVDILGRLMQEAHPYTHGHLHRVASWAKKIGEAVGLPPESMSLIADAAILHDIGKISIDDRILNKIGKLTDDEWEIIRAHPVTGAEVLGRMRYFDRVTHWIRHHHERIDGGGYPDHLKGNEIPLESRIICVVDSYDAMVGGASKEETRPYRPPMTAEAAQQELLRCAGTQFDEAVVSCFLEILRQEAQAASNRSQTEVTLTLVSSSTDSSSSIISNGDFTIPAAGRTVPGHTEPVKQAANDSV